ncbi:hypothetical protein NBRC10513v2_006221 [Rhodotorula toruloides]
MVSALDHKNTARLHEVLLRHENPAWPYTTLKEALALVEYLVRLNRIKKSKELSVRLDALTKQSELSWSDVAPRQWENFRSVCQETLRRLSEGQPVRDFLKPLRVIAVFAVGDYTEHPKSFSKGGTVERRYRSGTHAEVCFWFLQERGHSEGALSAERLRLLSEGAQNALLEHVKYIANLDPLPAMHELPSATQLLTNAELAASYIKIKEAVSACRLPTAVKAQYEKVLDFPYITTLPLELVAELTNALEVAAEQGHKPTLHHLSGTAAVEIYTKRVDAVVRHLRTTFIRPQDIEKWKEEYLMPLKGWNGAGWSPAGMAAEWTELQRVDNDLIVKVPLSIEDLPKHALAFRHREGSLSLSHPYPRISHRMARRIGTSKEAWEAERASKAF